VYVYLTELIEKGISHRFLRNDLNFISLNQDLCYSKIFSDLQKISNMAPKPIKLYSHAGVSQNVTF